MNEVSLRGCFLGANICIDLGDLDAGVGVDGLELAEGGAKLGAEGCCLLGEDAHAEVNGRSGSVGEGVGHRRGWGS